MCALGFQLGNELIYASAVLVGVEKAQDRPSDYDDMLDHFYCLAPMKRIATFSAENSKGAVITGPIRRDPGEHLDWENLDLGSLSADEMDYYFEWWDQRKAS